MKEKLNSSCSGKEQICEAQSAETNQQGNETFQEGAKEEGQSSETGQSKQ